MYSQVIHTIGAAVVSNLLRSQLGQMKLSLCRTWAPTSFIAF